jgi:UDP-N-acetylglucosamine--N-acetylmuramyl-(pentapeptide) pyrophosphoryl-undecaprenol N-acetylglucosamine transferase
MLEPRIVPTGATAVWLTPPNAHADALLAGEIVYPLVHTAPRDLKNTVRNLPVAIRVLRQVRPRAVVSTGAAVAVVTLGVARGLGIEAHYIESAARTDGPSFTGRLLEKVPGVHLYTQWPRWSGGRWEATGSVFDGFRAVAVPATGISRVVVTFGMSGYGFRRLVVRLIEVLPKGVEVLWQTGSTDVSGLGIEARPFLAADELVTAMAKADLVVAHAGVGSALGALGVGRCPVLVPRERAFNEHIDDHQALIGAEIGQRQLAVTRRLDELVLADLEQAAAMKVEKASVAPLGFGGWLGAALLSDNRPGARGEGIRKPRNAEAGH